MTIPYEVNSLDAVPEPLRGEYAASDDGKFRLNLEGHPEGPEALKTVAAKEREARREVEKELSIYKKLGKTPQQIGELAADAGNVFKKSADFDATLKQITDKATLEKAELAAERDAARAFASDAIADATLTSALTSAKVTAEGLDLLSDRLRSRISIEAVDGKIVAKIMMPDGKAAMPGKGPDGAATVNDLVGEARQKWPSLFRGSGAGGGGAPSKQGAAQSKSMSRAEFDALGPNERSAAVRAGKTIVD